MQGVVLAYDPLSREGILVSDVTERDRFVLAANALDGSVFRTLRQGQRVIFDLDDAGRAIKVRTGAEADLAGPTAIV